MGNIQAASPGIPPPAPPQPIPLAVPPVAEEKKSEEGDVGIENPGTMEDLHKKCKDVFPVMFEGGKFMLNKGLSNHFQVSHTINFSTLQPPGYRFGATFVGTQQVSPSEAYPVMLGDVDPSGNLNANIIHQVTPSVRAKFVAQIQQSKWQATQLTMDWRGADHTTSLTLGNIDMINGSGVAVTHYLQQVTKNIALGTELAYQYGSQVPGGHIAVYSLAGRYTGSNFTASGTLGGAGVHLCYYQKATEQLQFGVELETSLRMQESVASMAYQLEIPKANTIFRGTLDSNWTVGAVMEKKLMPLPFTLALSAMLNHPKNQFKLGCGFIIG
ncbi:mitochondrial import receptor subunit TOM40 homolog 1 [Panulirus ornatus]|uniref:mitochondrial import receptor subunit TOM40 homolog 1 n=1 Tax=Panulirus ornatus TaxID=150431 RepID=UPI003A898C1E